MKSYKPFNPLDKVNLGASIASALLASEVVPLNTLEKFAGVGIYALYYLGDFPAYRPLAQLNQEGRFLAPIYVGKAESEGRRKGLVIDGGADSINLFKRLRDHVKTIEAATNLDIGDFWCRFLVVDETFVHLGEILLINRLAPLWNQLVDGFGNHSPGKGRHGSQRPRWDVLHPGRKWAEKCAPRLETAEQIANDVSTYFRTHIVIQESALYVGKKRNSNDD